MHREKYVPTPQSAVDEANASCHYPCIVLRDARTAVDTAALNHLCNSILVEFTAKLKKNKNFSQRLYMTLYEYGPSPYSPASRVIFSDCQVKTLEPDALINNHFSGYGGTAEAIQWLCGQCAQWPENAYPALVLWIGKDTHALPQNPQLSGALNSLSRLCEENRIWLVMFDMCSEDARSFSKKHPFGAQLFFPFNILADVRGAMQTIFPQIIQGYQAALTQTPLKNLKNYNF